jgi:hypothetical protein
MKALRALLGDQRPVIPAAHKTEILAILPRCVGQMALSRDLPDLRLRRDLAQR